MAVLVTGGAGYIGSHTAVALHDAGRHVVVLDDLSNSSPAAVDALRSLTRPDLSFVEADAADVDAVGRTLADHRVDEVVHFAAFKSVSGSIANPEGYHRNNVGCTSGVVAAMRAHGVSRLVFSSSCTVYGEPDDVPVIEASPIGATNPYGATKVACEELLATEADAGGLDILLLRYFNPVGAHPSGDLGEDPRGVPDDDGPKGCTAVNLGTGTGYSVLDVVVAASRVVGRPVPHEVVGRRAGDIERIWADPSLAVDLLGWRASRSLDEMLADHWRGQQRHPDGYDA